MLPGRKVCGPISATGVTSAAVPTRNTSEKVGTAAEVTPVAEIGPHVFKPGNISLSLMDDYAQLVRRALQPA